MVDKMATGTLRTALEREHREIDAGIEAYSAAAAEDPGAPTEALLGSLAALRRHIWLEEEFLFPPLRSAGLMAPVFVMLREHGQMWRTMDSLEPRLRDGADDQGLRELQDLVGQLAQHNFKEESILYSQADEVLDEEATAELADFLDSGEMPPGWTCTSAMA